MPYRFLITSALVLMMTCHTYAQTGAALAQQPWDEQTQFDVSGEARWFGEADIDDTSNDIDLLRFESRGRYRPNAQPGGDEVRVGYDLLHLDLDTSDTALPERLTDVSTSMSWMRQLEQGRRFGVTTGVGYAGDAPFGESDAVYFTGNLIYEQPLSQQSKLTFTLNYNGNRTIFPDIPLPLVAYTRRASDELTYTIGMPFSSVRWQPTERWRVTASYVPVLTADVRVDYRVKQGLHLFGQFDNEYNAFVVDGNEDRRLFFQQRRLEAGISYEPTDRIELIVAGGYAFDQAFERGWDVRDTDTVRELDSAPFIRAEVGITF